MGREGRRHVVTWVRPEPMLDRPREIKGVERPELSIKTVMKVDAKATPISIFIGLDSAPSATERVELALKEMDRTDAWSRELIMLTSPTGTGYVNYVAIACAQYMTLGNMASVTLQYSKRPSPLSLGKIGQAKEQNRLLWLKILERIRLMSPEDRPKVVIFGESLGAHTSQAAFEGWGTLGPQALGIDRALWIGTPEASRWRHELVGRERPDVDRSRVAVVNDYEEFLALGYDAKEHAHYVLLSHDNDGVTKFGANLINRRPDWLGPDRPRVEEVPGRSPRGIPASMRWRPVTTFFQLLVDMKNAQLPGSYKAWAHDYRTDLPGVHPRRLRPRLHRRAARGHQGRLPAARRVPRSRLRLTDVDDEGRLDCIEGDNPHLHRRDPSTGVRRPAPAPHAVPARHALPRQPGRGATRTGTVDARSRRNVMSPSRTRRTGPRVLEPQTSRSSRCQTISARAASTVSPTRTCPSALRRMSACAAWTASSACARRTCSTSSSASTPSCVV